MTVAENMLTPEEAREVKLPLLPWRRVAQIRKYAGELVIPGDAPFKAPRTREGLVQLARDRHLHDDLAEYEARIKELTQNGLGAHEAFITVARELFNVEDPTEQPTLFEKE